MYIHAVVGVPFSNITIFKFYTSIIIHYTQYTTMHFSQARIQEFSSQGGGGSISGNIWQPSPPPPPKKGGGKRRENREIWSFLQLQASLYKHTNDMVRSFDIVNVSGRGGVGVVPQKMFSLNGILSCNSRKRIWKCFIIKQGIVSWIHFIIWIRYYYIIILLYYSKLDPFEN